MAEYVDPFADITTPSPITVQQFATLRWINIAGFNKCGKTEFIVKLMQDLRVILLDLEEGAKQYPGIKVIRVGNSYADLEAKLKWIYAMRDKLRPHIIAIDPLDRFYDLVEAQIKKENGLKTMADIEYGQAYALARDRFDEMLRVVKPACEMLLSVTHLKLASMGKDAGEVTFLDMNLPGKVKSFVQDTVDANLLFYRDVNEKGENYLACRADKSQTMSYSFEGSRLKAAYDFRSADDLRKYLVESLGHKEKAAEAA